MIDRRSFVALAAGAASRTKEEWRNRQSGMAYRRLGRTGFMVSEVVMGGNSIRENNWEHILPAIDMGLNYLDTAPAYGRGASELGYAKVLKARPRDRYFLNTKVSVWDNSRNKLYQEIFQSLPASDQERMRQAAAADIERRRAAATDYFIGYFEGQKRELMETALSNVMEKEYGRKIDRDKNYRKLILDSVDESLKRLNTDHVDLLTCPHGANSGYDLLNYPEIFDAFEKLKKAGKVRYLSVSAHNDPAGVLEAAVKSKVYSAAMVAYNIVNHGYVDAALARAKKNDLGVIAMKVARPVFSGRDGRPAKPENTQLIERAMPGPMHPAQKAYVWALRNPNLSCVISEMESSRHVEDNVPLAGKKA